MTQTVPKEDQGELPGGGNSWGDSLNVGLSLVVKGAMAFKRGPGVKETREQRGLAPSVHFSPVAQLYPTLQPHERTPGLPVHHHPLASTQTHVHRVGDAIQSSHPLLSLSPPAFNLSQHQGVF